MAKEDIVKHQFTSEQSRKKAAENGRKGGIASGEAKRAKRDMQFFAKLMLDEIITDKKGNELPTRYAMLKSVLKKVLKDGDVQAFKTIAAQAGEQPKEANNNVVIINNYNGLTAEAQDALEHIDEL